MRTCRRRANLYLHHTLVCLCDQPKLNETRTKNVHQTLGIIMGAFIACWLPFFLGYVTMTVCDTCRENTPVIVVDILFWIGYFNSSLNPVIYAYFNREFREAFKETIQNVCTYQRAHIHFAVNQLTYNTHAYCSFISLINGIFFVHTVCCCCRFSCLQTRRNNSAIHFNCTYRSTQDIDMGLVENKYVKD